LLLLYSATLLVSAGLLFVVEPLVAKSLLPIAGGTAAAWTTSAAFFQTTLLAGYLYAHALHRWVRPKVQGVVHVLALVAVFFVFPLRGPAPAEAPAGMEPLWLFGQLGALIGAPFFVLSATAPLLQHWLSISRHTSSRDPYFLYSASNAGSLLALLAYPFAVEPLIGLSLQRRIWTAAFAAEIALVAACGVVAWRTHCPARVAQPDVGQARALVAPTWWTRFRWMALAAVPSSLLLSVTSYISADLASLPLLWVGPLAIYLITFVLAFAKGQPLPRERTLWLQPFLLIPLFVGFTGRLGSAPLLLLPLHAFAFFVTALACHQTLALARPDPSSLTEYYVWISAGGALGGLFNVLVAPVAFSDVVEYPLGIALAVLLVRPWSDRRAWVRDLGAALGAAAAVLGTAIAVERLRADGVEARLALPLMTGLAGLFVFASRSRPFRLALGMAALAGAAFGAPRVTSGARVSRSFYGVHAVIDQRYGLQELVHGNTLH